jgi:hypothetical protein
MIASISLQQLRATLAALSATGLVACAGGGEPPAQSPVDAKEVPAAASAPATDAPASDAQGTETTANPSPSPAAPDAKAATDAKPTGAPPPSEEATTTTPPAVEAKPAATKANAKRKAAGAKGGCGAGTCG